MDCIGLIISLSAILSESSSQHLSTSKIFWLIKFQAEKSILKIGKQTDSNVSEQLMKEHLHRNVSVSYTHLDVYKRQLFCTRCSAAALPSYLPGFRPSPSLRFCRNSCVPAAVRRNGKASTGRLLYLTAGSRTVSFVQLGRVMTLQIMQS